MRRAPRCPSPLKCTWRTKHRNLLLQNCNAKIGRKMLVAMKITDLLKRGKLTDSQTVLAFASIYFDRPMDGDRQS